MFSGTNNIPQNIFIFIMNMENIMWNTISPVEQCYGSD